MATRFTMSEGPKNDPGYLASTTCRKQVIPVCPKGTSRSRMKCDDFGATYRGDFGMGRLRHPTLEDAGECPLCAKSAHCRVAEYQARGMLFPASTVLKGNNRWWPVRIPL